MQPEQQLARDWMCMAENNLTAAAILLQNGSYRSAISRSYYAGYSAMNALVARVRPDRINPDRAPEHRDIRSSLGREVEELIDSTAAVGAQGSLVRSLQSCWNLRVLADYRPFVVIDQDAARTALREAAQVVEGCGRSTP